MVRRGPALKRLRYYLSQMPPENPLPHKKLNAASRAVLDNKSLQNDGLHSAIDKVQEGLLLSFLRQMRRSAGGAAAER